nr:MAG TPA: hypothetical protein [Caudoviricetes sp.]
MATIIIIDRIISIFTILIVCAFSFGTYLALTETWNKKEFAIYTVALIVGVIALIYNIGRTVILWLY